MRITLVNTANLLAKPPEKISHSDIFSSFTEKAPAIGEALEITYRGKNCGNVERVIANSPEFSGNKDLHFNSSGDTLKITVEPGTFAGFLEINISLKR